MGTGVKAGFGRREAVSEAFKGWKVDRKEQLSPLLWQFEQIGV